MKKFYLLVFVVITAVQGWSQVTLPHTDPINYTVGQGLQTQTGWTSLNSGDDLLIASGNLSYPGFASSTGNKVTFDGTGIDAAKSFTQQTSGTVYFSFLFDVTSLGSLNTSGSYFAGFTESANTTFGATLWIRADGAGYDLGINPRTTAANTVWTSGTTNINSTALIVISYSIVSGTTNDIVKLWVNPTPGGTEPAATVSATNTLADLANLNRILIRQDALTTTPFIQMDELRIGTTWADVTPGGVNPSLGVAPSSLSFGSIETGTQSSAQSFDLSGSNLTGAPSVITVNSPSTDFEVSNDNATWGASTTISYSSSTLTATPVYVRFTPQSGGVKSGNITFSGGGVTTLPTVSVSGTGTQTYYSKAIGNLTDVTTWGTGLLGLGTSPTDFTSDGQLFIIANRLSTTLDANWTVSGSGSKVVTGDGLLPTTFVIPFGTTMTGTIDVSSTGTLRLEDATIPTIGTLATGSTIEYAQGGTYVVPQRSYYNLSIIGGTKTMASGITNVLGNLVLDGVTGFNGAASPFSTIVLTGNLAFFNNAAFEPNGTGDANRLTLTMAGTTTQTISGGDVYVFRLQTQTTPATTLNINLVNANLYLGNTSSGGLNLAQATHTLSLNGNTLTIQQFGVITGTAGSITGSPTSTVTINKSAGSALGTITFTSGSSVLGTLNYNNAAATNTMTLGTALTVGTLNFTAGNILLGANNLTVQTSITGASTASHIVTNGTGGLVIPNVGSTPVIFPVGPSVALYHPATITNNGTADDFTVRVASTTPACTPANTSVTATWDIAEATAGGSNCMLSLDFTGAATGPVFTATGAQIVHCNGVVSDYHNGSVSGTIATGAGFTSFSPFGISNDNSVLPVGFTNVRASQQGAAIKVEWTNMSESGVVNYQVERSANGTSFTSIQSVSPRVNNGGRADYTIVDASPLDGTNYYRIAARNADGSAKTSIIVKVSTKGGKTELNVYPNPVSDNNVAFQVSSLPKGAYTLRIISANGQQVASQRIVHAGGNLTQSVMLPVSTARGLYNLQLTGENEVKLNRTFIVR